MLITQDELAARIESPDNLINRLRSSLSSRKSTVIPSLPPSSSDIIDDLESKIKVNSIKSKAQGIMVSAMDELATRVAEVDKPEKLASIAKSMSEIVDNVEGKNKGKNENIIGQIIIYSPQVVKESEFETIDIQSRDV